MAHIDYFFSPISPWCYLAGLRLEEIATRHGATITYKPIDILSLFDRTGGTRPAARHPNRLAYRAQELTRWSDRLGLPLTLAPAHFPTNQAPAAYAIIAAQKAVDQGGSGNLGGLVHAILRACWAEDRNIAEDKVIRDALTANGFDDGLVHSGLFTGAETYERNLEEAIERGVFGAPFYIVRDTDQRFWGQDRLDFLDAHLGGL